VLHHAWECEQAFKVERLCHARLDGYRTQGEWFDVTADHAAQEVMLAISDVYIHPTCRRIRFSSRWTKERNNFLADNYISSMSSKDIISGILTLPGDQDIRWEMISEHAHDMNLRRPKKEAKPRVRS